MSLDPIISQRSELRKKALALRDGISPEMRDAYSQLIRKRTIEFLDQASAQFVHCYLGFRSEVATQGLIEDLLERGIKVAVPVVRGETNAEFILHSLIENLDHLQLGKFGLPEPSIVNEVSVSDLDAVLLPVVSFDGLGMRLGYGKGFYDKFLSGISPKIRRIGLAFSIQEMEKIPMLSHDQLMNNIITEQSTFFFK